MRRSRGGRWVAARRSWAVGREAARGSARPGSQPPRLLPRPQSSRAHPPWRDGPPGAHGGWFAALPGPYGSPPRKVPPRGLLWPLPAQHAEAFLLLLRPFPHPRALCLVPGRPKPRDSLPHLLSGDPGVCTRLVTPAHCPESIAGWPSRKSGSKAFTSRPGAAHWPEAARAAFRPQWFPSRQTSFHEILSSGRWGLWDRLVSSKQHCASSWPGAFWASGPAEVGVLWSQYLSLRVLRGAS